MELLSRQAEHLCLEEDKFDTSTRADANTGVTLDPWEVPLDISATPETLPRQG